MFRLALALVALSALPFGCGGANDVESELLAAVEKHLSKRTDLDMSAMELSIVRADVSGDRAEAEVDFRAKGAASSAMSMTYSLRRAADGWEVEPKSGPAGHGGMQQGAPPLMPPSGGGMPPDHPPVQGGEQPQALPPGHPPVSQ